MRRRVIFEQVSQYRSDTADEVQSMLKRKNVLDDDHLDENRPLSLGWALDLSFQNFQESIGDFAFYMDSRLNGLDVSLRFLWQIGLVLLFCAFRAHVHLIVAFSTTGFLVGQETEVRPKELAIWHE